MRRIFWFGHVETVFYMRRIFWFGHVETVYCMRRIFWFDKRLQIVREVFIHLKERSTKCKQCCQTIRYSKPDCSRVFARHQVNSFAWQKHSFSVLVWNKYRITTLWICCIINNPFDRGKNNLCAELVSDLTYFFLFKTIFLRQLCRIIIIF